MNKEKFLDYLFSIGYDLHDYNSKGELYKIGNNSKWSAKANAATVYLIKDNDTEHRIYWGRCRGLCIERYDTLRVPLPFDAIGYEDDEIKMEKIFKTYSPEIIYEAMFDKSKRLSII